jgi:hypothetical protein
MSKKDTIQQLTREQALGILGNRHIKDTDPASIQAAKALLGMVGPDVEDFIPLGENVYTEDPRVVRVGTHVIFDSSQLNPDLEGFYAEMDKFQKNEQQNKPKEKKKGRR